MLITSHIIFFFFFFKCSCTKKNICTFLTTDLLLQIHLTIFSRVEKINQNIPPYANVKYAKYAGITFKVAQYKTFWLRLMIFKMDSFKNFLYLIFPIQNSGLFLFLFHLFSQQNSQFYSLMWFATLYLLINIVWK